MSVLEQDVEQGLHLRRLFEGIIFFVAVTAFFLFGFGTLWQVMNLADPEILFDADKATPQLLTTAAFGIGALLSAMLVILIQFSQDMLMFRRELTKMEKLQRRVARESGLLQQPQTLSSVSTIAGGRPSGPDSSRKIRRE